MLATSGARKHMDQESKMTKIESRADWSMETLAVCISIALNLVFLSALNRFTQMGESSHKEASGPELRTVLYLVPNEVLLVPPASPIITTASIAKTSGQNQKHLIRVKSLEAEAQVPQRSSPVIEVAGNDQWSGITSPQSGFSVPTALSQTLGTSRASFLSTKKNTIEFTFTDRTVGGRLARLAHLADCKELRSALRRGNESADVIAKSMAKRDCTP